MGEPVRLFQSIAGLRCFLERSRLGKKVGLVPTMGALHAGHLSLIEQACRDNEIAIATIFVNPLQFGPTEDYQQYPRTLEQDLQLCQQLGVAAIFAPTAEELYGNHIPSSAEGERLTQVVPPTTMTSVLCGRSRPGHFQGVATIVTKLLNIVQPTNAYFGQKDAQQLAIIRRLVADLNLPVNIVGCPIVREQSGLAYSSRNHYLTPEEKEQATVLSRALKQAEKIFQSGERQGISLLNAVKEEFAAVPEAQLEYVELVHPKTLKPLEQVEEAGLLAIAARLGSTRLIDNFILRHRRPIVAIDGPAGAGKSTVARQVAQSLGLLHLDTGAMYRAITWLVLESGIDIGDECAIAELTSQAQLQFSMDEVSETVLRVWINGKEVTQAIRSSQVTANVSAIAAQAAVRQALVRQQQRWGQTGGIVAEGRDIGTHVFPDAEVKIFLTASVQERARRRQQDLKSQGQGEFSLEQLQHDISTRDTYDSTRALAPLQKAADAREVNTDGLSVDQVTQEIVSLVRG